MDDSEFSWFSGFGYDAEWRGLKGTNESFDLRSRKWSDVTLLFKLELYDAVKFRKVFGDRCFVGRGESLRNGWNTSVEAITELVRKVWVSHNESSALKELLPGVWFVRRLCITLSLLEGIFELHDPIFHNLSIVTGIVGGAVAPIWSLPI